MTTRPAEFDAAVMAYVPGLRNLAKRYVPREYRNDLVTDTLVLAFTRWESFMPTGGMWAWLSFLLRDAVKDQTAKAATKKRDWRTASHDQHQQATKPTQLAAAELSSTLSLLASIKDGDILLQYSMGDTLDELASATGIPRETLRQRKDKARAKLHRIVGVAA